MAEPFKNLINSALVRTAAHALDRAVGAGERARVRAGKAPSDAFDASTFERLALTGLDALELKARAHHVASALLATLAHADAAQFDAACSRIERALAPPIATDDLASARNDVGDGLAGWIVWPLAEFVQRAGIERPERALLALHALTQRFTAEWSIRPADRGAPRARIRHAEGVDARPERARQAAGQRRHSTASAVGAAAGAGGS
jgi:hypothetical protein